MKGLFRILIIVALAMSFSTCKKKSFDPMSKSLSDFAGSWTGNITTFRNNKLEKESGLFLIYPGEGGAQMEGIMYLKEKRVFRQFQFQNGTLYFNILNNDPSNPYCQNWTLGGYAAFSSDDRLEIRISGNECGLAGSQYVDWSGTLEPSNAIMDSLPCFTFAKTGNNWTYSVKKEYGDSCEILKLLAGKSGTYNFSGESTHNCGWPVTNIPVRWSVSPAMFTLTNDNTLTNHEITIPVSAKYGAVYKSFPYPDTVTLTLLDSNKAMSTPAGNFLCNYYKYTETGNRYGVKTTRVSYLWVDYHYGVIRHEVTNPFDSSGIVRQILKSKNFQGN